ncbi:MAG TPA: TonB-dependent receptor, partial [Vicinamibacterales bacterium]|nr:TonB-dependent receptor [Vicinamibacterales bacterium]
MLLLLVAGSVFAQPTTGSLDGTVTDPNGGALPGVTVQIAGPSMQGTRVTTTDTSGDYRFTLLPPGVYEVRYELDGFAPQQRNGAVVSLGKATTLDVTLAAASVSEELTVVAAAPVLDTTSTTVGTNLDQRAIETLPTGRNYASIAQVAPGVSTDASNNNTSQSTITVYGSSGAENAFFIDGVNTTNMEYGFQGKELNFEFIQEVEVKTGGYEAEYGRSTGGIINVITKQGGNEFHGDVFGYYDADSFQSDAKPIVSTGGVQESFTKSDFGVDLGGYILRDKLWFFAAYDRVAHSADIRLPEPFDDRVVTSESDRDLASAKLTYNVAPSQSLVFSFFQDPRADTGAISDAAHSLRCTESTYLGVQDFGGRDYALRYDAALSSNWVIVAQAARHQEQNSVGPATSAGNEIQYRDVQNDFAQTGGFGLIQDKQFQRDHYG